MKERTIMPVASVIVETENGAGETVLTSLARMTNVNVYGVKENQIVTVVEGDSAEAVNESVSMLAAIDKVIGVYPVFAGMYE